MIYHKLKKLKDILYGVAVESIKGSTDIPVSSIEFDSRKIESGALFVAQKGLEYDGHGFIAKAILQGAVAVICQEIPSETSDEITYVKVVNSDEALALTASNFYDNPSDHLELIGVTGTNGKTTIATLLSEQFQNAGFKSGLISTISINIGDIIKPTRHTTPDFLVTPLSFCKTVSFASPPRNGYALFQLLLFYSNYLSLTTFKSFLNITILT